MEIFGYVFLCVDVGVQGSPHKPYAHWSQLNKKSLLNVYPSTDRSGHKKELWHQSVLKVDFLYQTWFTGQRQAVESYSILG